MYRNFAFRFFPGLWLILALILVTNRPGECEDHMDSSFFGPGFHILPITRALMEMPMPISFNGISRANPQFEIRNEMGENGIQGDGVRAGVRLSMPAAGINTGLARIRNTLFRYIQVSGLCDPGDISAADGFDDLETGSGAGTGDITLEFQADITDMSGALFFVMKI